MIFTRNRVREPVFAGEMIGLQEERSPDEESKFANAPNFSLIQLRNSRFRWLRGLAPESRGSSGVAGSLIGLNQARDGEFPCIFPSNREFDAETGSLGTRGAGRASDALVANGVGCDRFLL